MMTQITPIAIMTSEMVIAFSVADSLAPARREMARTRKPIREIAYPAMAKMSLAVKREVMG